MKKKLTIGILAHVDAGKTTLSEALLYLSGKIRALGRVDHRNTYLDTYSLERERGITIFSKQARFSTENCDFILLDTPGHADFSPEAERTLSLLDYAVLVVSAPDGVQNHTRTLWQLLAHYSVPTFIFVNKTDITIKFKEDIEAELSKSLSSACVAFYESDEKSTLDERLASAHEDFLNSFFAGEEIEDSEIAEKIYQRQLFPCFFGSALKTEGVEFFLSAIDRFTVSPEYPSEQFGAKVYKIAHASGTRITYMKLTGGSLSARDEINYLSSDGTKFSEKVSQIRLYSGDKFEQVDTVFAGEICAVIGFSATYVGQGLGVEMDSGSPVLEPVLSYRILLPDGCDPMLYFPKLKELEEEEPSLHLYWNEELAQIEARLMGDIQIDLLKKLIYDRFTISAELDEGRILYKEKAAGVSVGVGHFEPLRHYAEVQLLIEPQPKGTGLVFDTDVSENDLAMNWQRLVLSHLYSKTHRGTLTGAVLTDTKITLVAGRAHQKHTEGGDFREATLRALRQGLMKSGCVLLEPFYRFRVEVPVASVGRAMTDLQSRGAEFAVESSDTEYSVIVGRGPASELHSYSRELTSYTRGEGRMTCVSDGYYPCHDQERVVAEAGYDPVADTENPPHSVFCDHGAGFVVPWDKVDEYKHLEYSPDKPKEVTADKIIPRASTLSRKYDISDKELETIMMREFGPIKRRKYSEPKINSSAKRSGEKKKKTPSEPKNLLIIDGYNVIYAWESLRVIAEDDFAKARDVLMDILSNYVAFTKIDVILVFDAYLVKDGVGSDFIHDGYRVVFTREDQTADAYIEKLMHDMGPDYSIKVVTGDGLLQSSAVMSGISRMSTAEFEAEAVAVGNEITAFVRKLAENKK